MKYLIDTNIILELILQREHYDEAVTLISHLRSKSHEMYMTAGGFYGLIYTIDKYLRKVMEMKVPERTDTLRSILRQILNTFKVSVTDYETLIHGIDDTSFTDLEDSCQYHSAKRMGCDCLLTFNVKDYLMVSDNSVQVLTPQQLLTSQ